MSRGMRSTFLAALASCAVMACSEQTTLPKPGDKLTGFSVGEIQDTTITGGSPGAQTGTNPIQAGGIVRGVGEGQDTMATAPKLAGVVVKAYKHLGYSGNEVLIGEQVGSLTTDDNGWYGYFTLPPGSYVVTFTPPANSAFRSIYVTHDSPGAPPGSTIVHTWAIFLPRK